jgi:hypothetical protein
VSTHLRTAPGRADERVEADEDSVVRSDSAHDTDLIERSEASPTPVAGLAHAPSSSDPLGGSTVDSGIASALSRRQGSGQSLAPGDATRFGKQFGADLSAVRVHRDTEADSISRSIQATAFSLGNDMYFSQGAYAPGTSSGDRLIAHELAHVTAKPGSASGGAPKIGRADDPAEAEADRVADHVVSGLRSKTSDGDDHAGHDHSDGDVHRSIAPTLTVPGLVRRQRDPNVISRSLGKKIKEKVKKGVDKVKKGAKKISNKVRTAMGVADPTDDEKLGVDYVDDMSHEERMTMQHRARGSGPGENPDYSNVALWGQDPDRFVVTLAAAQEDPAWMRNINALKSTALKEVVTSPKKLLGDLPGAQARIVEKTLLSQGKLTNKTEMEIKGMVEQFTSGLHDVGHTWVRLQTYVGGKLKDLYSYGMWPQKLYSPNAEEEDTWNGGYRGFVSVGPGEVKHPDTAHEGDSMKAYKDYEVPEKSFDKALDLAIDRYNSPPPYVLTGYNCTAFAREILVAAGKSYPGAGVLPGFAYTPGNLYWAIMKEWAKGKASSYTNEKNPEAMESLQKRNKVFGEAGEKNVNEEHAMETMSTPDPEADREVATFYKGREVKVGEAPNAINKKLTMADDTKVTWVDDGGFIDYWKVIPLEFGPKMLFISEDEFDMATAKKKKSKSSGSGSKPPPPSDNMRSRMMARGMDVWDGGGEPPDEGTKPAMTVSAGMAGLYMRGMYDKGDWQEVTDMRENWWVLKEQFNFFADPDKHVFDDEREDSTVSKPPSSDVQLTGPVKESMRSKILKQGLPLWDGSKPPADPESEAPHKYVTAEVAKILIYNNYSEDGYVEVNDGTGVFWAHQEMYNFFLDPDKFSFDDEVVDDLEDSDEESSEHDPQSDDSDSDSSEEEAPKTKVDMNALMRAALGVFTDYSGMDLMTVESVLSHGVMSFGVKLTNHEMSLICSGEGSDERIAALADAIESDPKSVASYWRR